MLIRRILVLFVAGVLLGLFGVYYLHVTRPTGEFQVLNFSGQDITVGTVAVCGQVHKLPPMASGDNYRASHDIKGDDHYHVEVTLADGKKLVGDVGYVTNGIASKESINIKADGIVSGR